MPPNGGTLNRVPESVMRDSKSLTSHKEGVTDRLVLAAGQNPCLPTSIECSFQSAALTGGNEVVRYIETWEKVISILRGFINA